MDVPERKLPEDILETNEVFAERLHGYEKNPDYVPLPGYNEYAIAYHAENRKRLDAIRATKIEKLKAFAAAKPDDTYFNVDELDTMNPIELDRTYAYNRTDIDENDDTFWDVLELAPWKFENAFSVRESPGDVHLFASDTWGGGRGNFEWHIDASHQGCFNIDIPGHFCNGIEDLENMILALVDARNILKEKFPEPYFQWRGNSKIWEINEVDK